MDKPRKKAKTKGIGEPRTAAALNKRVDIRVNDEERERFREAARKQGITLSQWLRLAAWQAITDHGGKVKLLDLGE
jgi:predicted HicB family RNase H-like nuclease